MRALQRVRADTVGAAQARDILREIYVRPVDLNRSFTYEDKCRFLEPIQKSPLEEFGFPQSGEEVRQYIGHALSYDQAKKTPRWVIEHLTKEKIVGVADRKHCRFKPDPNIPQLFSASNEDYLRSGWSRGHMAPAGDSKYSTEAMAETFYLSNIVPQNYKNNAGFWNRFEMYCRDLTQRFDDVWIVSGPLLLPVQNEDGKKSVTYQFMSENLVRRMSRMTLEEEYKEYKEFLLELWRVSIELWEVEFEKNKFGGASRAPTLETIFEEEEEEEEKEDDEEEEEEKEEEEKEDDEEKEEEEKKEDDEQKKEDDEEEKEDDEEEKEDDEEEKEEEEEKEDDEEEEKEDDEEEEEEEKEDDEEEEEKEDDEEEKENDEEEKEDDEEEEKEEEKEEEEVDKFNATSEGSNEDISLHKHKWWMPKCFRRKNQTTIKNISKTDKKETERRPTNWLLRAFTCCFSRAGTQ
ncbi:uncharacterized protein [Dendrobates tinctorius]|uniref:uncharacterized protein n=1 Tax=Dendrobates tinctorius TaxID=92724 RepID=UPI003CC95DA9